MPIIDRILLAIFSAILPYRDIRKPVNGKEELYLRRFFLRRGSDRKYFLHFFNRSDDDPDLHDHPWGFTSYVLRGGYDEETFILTAIERAFWRGEAEKLGQPYPTFNTWRHPVNRFTKNVRTAEHAHRVLLRGNQKSWSIVVAGPKERAWGFVKPDGEHAGWRTYLGLPATTPDQPEDL